MAQRTESARLRSLSEADVKRRVAQCYALILSCARKAEEKAADGDDLGQETPSTAGSDDHSDRHQDDCTPDGLGEQEELAYGR